MGARVVTADLVFARESYEVFANLPVFKFLLKEHWSEIAHYPDIPLAPDWETYCKAEAIGALRVYVARAESAPVGYAIFFVRPHLHYKTSIQAQQDVLFVAKEHRGFGAKFLQWCDEQLRAEGVQVILHHVKAAHDFGPLLKRLGYELVDLVYARRVF